MLHEFQELDSKEAEEQRKRASQASKKTTRGFVEVSTKVPKKPPRKNNKEANNIESQTETLDNSSMEMGKPELLTLSCYGINMMFKALEF